ncbi:hypothetical protein, partial [Paraburkholderia silvatlantica]|uniref:hypothetical protein n=1 Tax=Paraburkholderia silvatlantica TaxID=321895 RepID=UPI001A9C34CD
LHHLVKHSFVPAILEQAARLPGLTHKDLERAAHKTPSQAAVNFEESDDVRHVALNTSRLNFS